MILKHNRKITCFIIAIISALSTSAQPPQFSIATDIGLQRSFKKEQQFYAFGHTVQVQFHLAEKDGVYFWLSYYTNGKFSNNVIATAKSPLTIPQQLPYQNRAVISFRQFSVGWKKYLKGHYMIETGWNLYSYAGFGLLYGRVANSHSVSIDTSDYFLPVKTGEGKFKRLTLDLGLGTEFPLGGDFYLYTEGRLWIPATDYPSKYVFLNENAPLVGMFNAGIRILF